MKRRVRDHVTVIKCDICGEEAGRFLTTQTIPPTALLIVSSKHICKKCGKRIADYWETVFSKA